jgi:hypothetical protein
MALFWPLEHETIEQSNTTKLSQTTKIIIDTKMFDNLAQVQKHTLKLGFHLSKRALS